MLSPATAVVGGTVTDSAGPGLVGAGLVLTGPANTYKTMSVSSPLGSFRFNGVAPGTYVLGAELYGRVTSYATVTAKVGGVASVVLKLAETPGGVLPATSHVQGRVTDARSGGPLSLRPGRRLRPAAAAGQPGQPGPVQARRRGGRLPAGRGRRLRAGRHRRPAGRLRGRPDPGVHRPLDRRRSR